MTALVERLEDQEIKMAFEKRKSGLLGIEAGRLGFLSAILIINLLIQIRQPEFTSTDLLFPLYSILFFSFFINAVYLWYIDYSVRHWSFTALLFAADAIFITALIYYTGVVQSIFIFLYLVNIIFCGLLFHKRGAFLLALLTSTLFSLLLILRPEIKGEVLFFAVGLNNLGFFSVAFLSGYLSEQLNFIGIELTARKKDLRALQNLNEMIVQNVTSGLMTIDLHGQILQYNRAAEQIVDRAFKLTGFNVNSVFPGFLEKIAADLGGHHKQVNAMDRFEYTHTNSRDEKVILGFSVSLLKHDLADTGYILIFQDLTQIKRLEKAMRRSEKLAAVGQLAAGIAHEIRNPLAGISGSLQLLRSNQHSEGSEDHRLMSIALREIDRLNKLITEFLDFVRPDASADDPLSIDDVIREVLEMVQLNKNIRAGVVINQSLKSERKILGHRDKLKQVFYNFIINAFQALDKAESPVITVSSKLRDGLVIVSIKDNGSGMNENTMRRLFEPFHTTKPQGTGLGLATVHKILENHDARVFVESELNKGTEFTVEFSRLVGASQATLDDNKSQRFSKRGNG
jgi:two-component system, NtrC family, sensor histidine kinase PilS